MVADWASYSAPHPEWANDDGFHLNNAGAAALSQFIAANIARGLVRVPAGPRPSSDPGSDGELPTS